MSGQAGDGGRCSGSSLEFDRRRDSEPEVRAAVGQANGDEVLLNPLTIRGLLRRHGRRRGWLLVLAGYFGAALSGLAVAGLFALLDLEVTHVPWFRGLVDRIIMALPFTMLGAPGGGIKGM